MSDVRPRLGGFVGGDGGASREKSGRAREGERDRPEEREKSSSFRAQHRARV